MPDYHDVKVADTLSEIAAEMIGRPVYTKDGSLNKLLRLNPGLDRDQLIFPHQRVRLRFEDPASPTVITTPAAPAVRYGPIAQEPSCLRAYLWGGFEPRYLGITQYLNSLGADFNAAGFSPVSLGAGIDLRWDAGVDLVARAGYRSVAHLNSESAQFRIGESDLNAWSAEIAGGYRLRINDWLSLGPRLALARDAYYFLSFNANTELRILQGAGYWAGGGLAGRAEFGAWELEAFARYSRPMLADLGSTVVASSLQSIRLDLSARRMFGTSRWGAQAGLAGEWRRSDLNTDPDQWVQSSRALVGSLALVLKLN